jgi:carbonic anhydrase
MKILVLFPLLCASVSQASLCDSGKHQSPVNITTAALSAQKLPPMTPDYRAAPLRLANDGHTLRVRFDKSGQLVIGKEHYTLQQFHFHTPGGDQINGENFPFAAHVLHKSTSGQLLAITVPFRVGAENALLNTLLPFIPERADGDHKHPQTSVNARKLLPTDLGYYRYSGSLTAAPCTEGVAWLVMKHPLELSATQLAQWRKHFADNIRGVNPLYQRLVQESP